MMRLILGMYAIGAALMFISPALGVLPMFFAGIAAACARE